MIYAMVPKWQYRHKNANGKSNIRSPHNRSHYACAPHFTRSFVCGSFVLLRKKAQLKRQTVFIRALSAHRRRQRFLIYTREEKTYKKTEAKKPVAIFVFPLLHCRFDFTEEKNDGTSASICFFFLSIMWRLELSEKHKSHTCQMDTNLTCTFS